MTRCFRLLLPVLALPLLALSACTTTPAPVVVPPPAPRLLGAASLDRSEGPARALQFVRPVCILDVYLYPPSPGAAPQVRTAAARRPDGSRIDPGACVALLLPPTG
jgi:hypothetical protein